MMIKIKKGIVFSYDIERILKGNNALGYNYQANGIIIPNNNFIQSLRKSFENDTGKIFGEVVTISEDDMLNSLENTIKYIDRRYPHCFTR